MKCSNHHEADAVALCNLCCRGLCKDCVTFTHDSAACLNRCEAIVGVERAIRERNFQVNKLYLDKNYPDEELLRYQANVVNYRTWLIILIVVWGTVLYRFYNTPPAQNGFFLGLLCLLLVILVSLVTSFFKWRKLLIARQAVLEKWRTL